jgi:hypothetical protein
LERQDDQLRAQDGTAALRDAVPRRELRIMGLHLQRRLHFVTKANGQKISKFDNSSHQTIKMFP